MRAKAVSMVMAMAAGGMAFAQTDRPMTGTQTGTDRPMGTQAGQPGTERTTTAGRPDRAATGTPAGHAVWKPDQGEWMPLPDLFPKGAMMKVMSGDPARGGSELYLRFPAKYVAPWHFHTPFERIYVDNGSLRFEHLDGTSTTLGEGGFMAVPPRMAHKVTCVSEQECTLFLSSNAPFDIHLIDKNGKVTRSWTASAAAQTTGGQATPR